MRHEVCTRDVLLSEEVAKTRNSILGILNELLFGLIPNVLIAQNRQTERLQSAFAHHLFSMESQYTRDLALPVFISDTFCDTFLARDSALASLSTNVEQDEQTFVNTAMDAYELPKFMPTMGGVDTSTGV